MLYNHLIWGAGQDRGGEGGGGSFVFRVTYWQQDKLTLTQRNV